MNSTVGFQKEDKERKYNLINSKADLKRNNFENLMQKIVEDDVKRETFYQNKIYKKAATQENYE